MKNFFLIVNIFTILLLFTNISYAADVSVKIFEEYVPFDEGSGKPFIDNNNRTQVPLRRTMEMFGADVYWNPNTKSATISKDGTNVIVIVNEKYILVNGSNKETDTIPIIINGRIYLPIRPVIEAFGLKVSWSNSSKTVIISDKEIIEQLASTKTNTNISNTTNTTVSKPKKTVNYNSFNIEHSNPSTTDINVKRTYKITAAKGNLTLYGYAIYDMLNNVTLYEEIKETPCKEYSFSYTPTIIGYYGIDIYCENDQNECSGLSDLFFILSNSQSYNPYITSPVIKTTTSYQPTSYKPRYKYGKLSLKSGSKYSAKSATYSYDSKNNTASCSFFITMEISRSIPITIKIYNKELIVIGSKTFEMTTFINNRVNTVSNTVSINTSGEPFYYEIICN